MNCRHTNIKFNFISVCYCRLRLHVYLILAIEENWNNFILFTTIKHDPNFNESIEIKINAHTQNTTEILNYNLSDRQVNHFWLCSSKNRLGNQPLNYETAMKETIRERNTILCTHCSTAQHRMNNINESTQANRIWKHKTEYSIAVCIFYSCELCVMWYTFWGKKHNCFRSSYAIYTVKCKAIYDTTIEDMKCIMQANASSFCQNEHEKRRDTTYGRYEEGARIWMLEKKLFDIFCVWRQNER